MIRRDVPQRSKVSPNRSCWKLQLKCISVFLVSLSMCGAGCWTDHRLVVSNLSLSKMADDIQSFADRKDVKKFFDSLKTVYGPQRSGTTHSLLQMELFYWLTKKLSWKDGLNTLMVPLSGNHLSTMKLSTDYHRWNVSRCLMSSQPPLKQWKQ